MALGDGGEQVESALKAIAPTEIIKPNGEIIPAPVEIPDLNPLQLEYCRLRALGMRDHEIRERLAVTQNTIRRLKNDPACQAWIEEIVVDAVESTRIKLRQIGDKAFKALEDSLLSANEQVKLAAAKDVLDRIGVKQREDKVITHKLDVSALTEEQIRERLKRLECGE